ncbi:hypothetical protein ACFFRR_006715 [Megaselia abdita]
MEKLCRVCSSTGEYDIFSKIPIYLFASQNEFLQWNQTIAEYLEETTGLAVTKGDGFPEKMCALCISYLKHATSFRQQVISNMVDLKAAQLLTRKCPDNEKLLITSDDLVFSDIRKTETNKLLNNQTNGGSTFTKIPLHHENTCSTKNHINHNREINKVEDEDLFTGSSDDNDASSSDNKRKTYFNYVETNFEEEDIMEVEELKGSKIVVNVPEYFKERKCRACSRRFMFEDSYNEHMEVCIEYKFLTFLEESNRLFDIRRNKVCSPHEFIRRMIFNLKKICNWLKNSCGENIILLNGVSDILKKQRLHSDEKSSEVSSGENCITVIEKKRVSSVEDSSNSLIDILRKSAEGDTSLIRNFNKTPDPLIDFLKNSSSDGILKTSTPTDSPLKDKISKKLDSRKQKSMHLTNIFERIATSSEEEEKENCIHKLAHTTPITHVSHSSQMKAPIFQKAQILPVPTTEPFAPVYPKINFSAKCNQCETKFSSIGELEEHNSKFHNKFSHENIENHKKIIALFEETDDLNIHDTLNGSCKSVSSKLDGLVDLF